ncbi:alanine racemase [Nocardioides mangrovi]|uniref:Alanine racemase n=1 Tax=Nocardioides mangrovi TaxID=2874580 RepID=A0ABS7UHA3_9ACTN|nr:alanine racemase [Nocardioides mangrovi]MBZ5740404.1 alanine racemase [Nocardioides mangrovi]
MTLALVTEVVAASRPRLSVDLDAVARNTRLLAGRASGELMAVVKADGFGHGALDVARTALAHGATRLGVTSLDEAWPLREAGLGVPLLSWLNPADADWGRAAAHDVDVAVPSLTHLAAVAAAPGRARVHLHVDAGMARDGADPASWTLLCRSARRAEQRGQLTVVGVMGHLGCADDPTDDCNALARTRFAWALEVARAAGLRPRDRHLAATAATLTDPRTHHTLSRVGAGLVGIDPSRTTALHPAMTLTAPVVQVRRVRAGTPVGYGHSHRTHEATHLGLLPVGYADGLPRAASGRAEVLVRGVRRPVVGRISMDQVVVDLGERGVDLGESATVFGPGTHGEPTVAEWAAWADTIEHEVVTGIGARVERSLA